MGQVIHIKDYLERKIEKTKKERDKIRADNARISDSIERLKHIWGEFNEEE